MTRKINEHSQAIIEALDTWKTIRDVLSGSAAVKANGTVYLPKASLDQTPAAYEQYKDEVTFYPATARTLAGLTGLVLGKAPVLEGPDYFLRIADEISFNGEGFVDVAEWALKEAFAMNFGGILVDYPSGQKPATEQQAIEEGWRPYVATYPAEDIIRVERNRVKNRNKLTYVELRDDALTHRVLQLDDNVYTVEIWKRDNETTAAFTLQNKVVPRRPSGETLDWIPFEVVNDNVGSIDPAVSTIEPVARLNLDHFRIEGRISYIHYWQSMAILWTAGAEGPEPQRDAGTDAEGTPTAPAEPAFRIGGPEAWMLSDAQGKVAYAEFSGSGVESLERKRDKIEQRMAIVGAQILAVEKAAAEAAETVAMRAAAQNSTLARTARVVARKLTSIARWVVWWMGGDKSDEQKTFFAFNTDYRVNTLTDGVITHIRGLKESHAMSDETMFYLLQRGGLYPEALTYDEELRRREEDSLREPAGFDPDVDNEDDEE